MIQTQFKKEDFIVDKKNTTANEIKTEATIIAEMLKKITQKEKERFYYMLKGVTLVSEYTDK